MFLQFLYLHFCVIAYEWVYSVEWELAEGPTIGILKNIIKQRIRQVGVEGVVGWAFTFAEKTAILRVSHRYGYFWFRTLGDHSPIPISGDYTKSDALLDRLMFEAEDWELDWGSDNDDDDEGYCEDWCVYEEYIFSFFFSNFFQILF